MNITEMTKLAGANKRARRVGRGRGSGHGKTSGRGHKGCGQRAGASRLTMREGGQMPTFRRIPKRGFSNAQFKKRFCIVNVADLEARFPGGAHVTPQSLREAGLIRTVRLPVKILGDGALTKKFQVDAAVFSKTAAEKIVRAGGEACVCV